MSTKLGDDTGSDVRIPKRVDWEIKDLVHPVTVRRRTLWMGGIVLMLLVAGGLAWYLLSKPPSGEALLAEMVEASGGMDRWHAIDEGSFTRIHTLYDESGNIEKSETETYYFQKGGEWRLLIESEGELGHVQIGHDGDGYWATKDGSPASPIVVARSLGMMCDSEYCTPQCAAEMAFFRFSLPFKLTDRGVRPRHAGYASLNGRQVDVLDVTYDPEIGSDRWVFFVDPDTRLIRKIEHYGSLEGDAPPEEIYWSDHRTVDGLTFSHRQSYYRSNGTKLEEYVVTGADFEGSLSDEMFIRPEKRPVRAASL